MKRIVSILFILTIFCSTLILADHNAQHSFDLPQAGPPENPSDNEFQYNHGRYEKTHPHGKVSFKQDIKSNRNVIETDSAIKVGLHLISIDSNQYPELNKPATLEFNSAYFNNPIILRNGVWEEHIIPELISFGRYKIEVEGFSTYQIVESNFTNGTFEDTTQADLGQGVGLTLEQDALLIVNFENNQTTDLSLNQYTLNHQSNTNVSIGGIDYSGGLNQIGNSGSHIQIEGINAETIIPSGSNFTIISWVKPAVAVTGGYKMGIFQEGNSNSGTYWATGIDTYNTNVYFYIGNGTNNVNMNPFAYTTNEWQMITYQWNGTHMIGQKNLDSQVSGEVTTLTGTLPNRLSPPSTGNNRNLIGSRYNDIHHFNGSIDNLYIFDRVLTQEEIETLYWSSGKRALFLDDNLEPSLAVNFNNGSAYDMSENYELTETGTVTYPLNVHSATTSADYGVSGGFSTNYQPNYSNGFSVGFWLNRSTTDTAFARIMGDENSGSAGDRTWTILTNNAANDFKLYMHIYNTTGDTTFTSSSSLDNQSYGEWMHYIFSFDNTQMKVYQNGVLKQTHGAPVQNLAPSVAGVWIGRTAFTSTGYAGGIDNIFMYEDKLTDGQAYDLYNSSAYIYKHKQQGNYTSQIIDSNNANPEVNRTSWDYLDLTTYDYQSDENFTDLINDGEVYVRASDNQGDVTSQSWLTYTYNGSHYTPATTSAQGIYGQYKFNLYGDSYGLQTDNVLGVTLSPFLYIIPNVTNTTINDNHLTPFTNDSITGYSTTSSSDTDQNIIEIQWLVNNINVLNDSSSALNNNTQFSSTITSSYYVKNDNITLQARACNAAITTICWNPVEEL